MTDEDRIQQRFEAARVRASARLVQLEPVKPLIGQVYQQAHHHPPDLSRSSEQDALTALAKGVVEASSNHAAESISDEMRAALIRHATLFAAADELDDEFPGDSRQVWVSRGGDVYHRYRDCVALEEGQQKAGTETRGLTSMSGG